MANSPAKATVAFKWDVIFPAQLMEMEGTPELGSATKDSGKSLQCTARKPYVYACVLSGGQKPIADGTVATFHFRVRTTAQPGTTTLRVENAVGTMADSKEVTLANTETIVIIK